VHASNLFDFTSFKSFSLAAEFYAKAPCTIRQCIDDGRVNRFLDYYRAER